MTDPVNKNLTYDWTKTRQLCATRGLKDFNELLAQYADSIAVKTSMTQDQVDALGAGWVEIVCTTFNRVSYNYWQRVKVAAYWLGFTPNPVKSAVPK